MLYFHVWLKWVKQEDEKKNSFGDLPVTYGTIEFEDRDTYTDSTKRPFLCFIF